MKIIIPLPQHLRCRFGNNIGVAGRSSFGGTDGGGGDVAGAAALGKRLEESVLGGREGREWGMGGWMGNGCAWFEGREGGGELRLG